MRRSQECKGSRDMKENEYGEEKENEYGEENLSHEEVACNL